MTIQKFWKKIVCGGMLCLVVALVPVVQALPPDPDNAALLYYQAFISFPKSHDMMSKQLRDVAYGEAEPNEAVRDYVASCANVLEFVQAAAQIPTCNWGYRYSQGFDALMPNLSQTRSLAFLVLADARIAMQAGDLRKALERCLTCKQMSRHVGDETLVSFLVGIAVERITNRNIRDFLGEMSDQVENLVWLKHQLSIVSGDTLELTQALRTEAQVALSQMVADNPEFVAFVQEAVKDVKAQIKSDVAWDDETFYATNRQYYQEFMVSMLAILDSTTPYRTRYAELDALNGKVDKEAQKNHGALLTGILAPAMSQILSRQTEHQSDNQALKTAVDIYLIKARTGKLPSVLPPTTPRDPFSGESFIYKKTNDGFVLRCQAEDLSKGKVHEYTFQTR